ncbi:MAG: tetratricopeptide repeat protein [Chitinophagaceae bacterium]|nr:tetratricopeptide repeat protein [Chitinophagaceae bacterium]
MTIRFIRILCIGLAFMTVLRATAQEPAAIDSMKRALSAAATLEQKAYWYDNLSRTMMNVNPMAADSLGERYIFMAEESRDRKLIYDAFVSNGIRCGYFRNQRKFVERSIDYFEKALDVARQNKMDKRAGAAQLLLADMYLAVPDKDKALRLAAEANSRISTLKDDSLKVEANNVYGRVYLARNDRILALRHHLMALDIAEEIKADDKSTKRMKSGLMRNCYLNLSTFYTSIGDYDKAIDKYAEAYKMLDNLTDRKVPYQRCIDINAMGNLFAMKKSYDIAISYFERSIRMADTLKFASLKLPGYVSMLNQYLRMDQPGKALNYLLSKEGQSLKVFLDTFRMAGVMDQAFAFVYTEIGQYDSARKYFDRALPFFESNMNETNRVLIYLQMGKLFAKTGESARAIESYTKAKEMGERNGILEVVREAASHMDTIYRLKGDYRSASLYNGIYYQYKDSIEKEKKVQELSQEEAEAEQLRTERLEKEQEEIKRRNNNIQYVGITLGIVLLFLALVILGMFKVSTGLIKAIGFFVFLMLFEFIFLIFKKKIYSITHGEPWKDLLFMIALAALLVPLHHWLEHRVLHYLTSHNRLTSAGQHIRKKLFRRTKEDFDSTSP